MATSSKNVVGISEEGARKIKAAVSDYKKELINKSNYWLSPSGIGKRAVSGNTSLKDFDNMLNMFMSDNVKYIKYLEQFENQIDNILSRYKSDDTKNNGFTSTAKNTLNQ